MKTTEQKPKNSQSKITSMWPFTKKHTSGNTSGLTKPVNAALPSVKLYQSIHELPLIKFIECICSQDLKHLIIEGEPDVAALFDAWETIYDEYIDGIADTEDKYIANLIKKRAVYEFKIQKVILIQKYLRYKLDYEIIDMLVKMQVTPGNFPKATPELQGVWFKKVTAKVKQMAIELRAIKIELEQLQPDATETVSRAYFDKVLVELSQFMKYHINERELTTGRYVAIYKEYKNFVTRLKMKDNVK